MSLNIKKISKYLLPFSYRFTVKTKDIQVIRGRYLITNIVGSSSDFGSKKQYWERHAKMKFSMCQVDQCRRQASVGAHVWVRRHHPWPWCWSWSSSSTDKTVFILPLCQVLCLILSCQVVVVTSLTLLPDLFTFK